MGLFVDVTNAGFLRNEGIGTMDTKGDENVDAEYTSPPPAHVVLYASLDVFEPANLHGSVYVGKSLVVGNARRDVFN